MSIQSRQTRERLWNTEDYEEALRCFPPKLVYEREMLSHLAKRPKDFLGAFYRLPKKLRQLFVQAYQSYLFNKFLSQRILRGLSLKEARREEYKLAIDGIECLAIPLIGYKQSVSMGEQGEIEKEILRNEEVTPQDFKIDAMPQISSPGGLRTALTPLIGLVIEDPRKDDANPNSKMVSLGFTLRKGSYATIILREFMKPSSPIRAGF
jgi:tRNA pseudouridine13 synthase